MNFFEARLELEPEAELWLCELLSQLNRAQRSAWRWANIPGNLTKPEDLSTTKLVEVGIVPDGYFTWHQESLIARKTQWDITTSKALAETAVQTKGKIAIELRKKLVLSRNDLETALSPKRSYEKQTRFDRRLSTIKSIKARILNREKRLAELDRSIDELKLQLAHNSFKKVFGSKALIKQRVALDRKMGTPKETPQVESEIGKWRSIWSESRDRNWLFEGKARAAGANQSVKGTGLLSLESIAEICSASQIDLSLAAQQSAGLGLKIRLSEDIAAARLPQLCLDQGIDYDKAQDLKCKQNKFSRIRSESEWIDVKLSFAKDKKQTQKLLMLINALRRNEQGWYASAVSWRIIYKDGIAYARACWPNDTATSTSAQNGRLGVDINGDSLCWAICTSDGNKPSLPAEEWNGKIPLELDGLTANQSLHAIRTTAKQIVTVAAKHGIPLALENLDFTRRKIEIGRSHPREANRLNNFRYAKIVQAIKNVAERFGVEICHVDPAFTSVGGYVKFGGALGLCADRAAAFAIARKSILSKNDRKEFENQRIKGVWTQIAKRHEPFPVSLIKAIQPQAILERKNGVAKAAPMDDSILLDVKSKRQSTQGITNQVGDYMVDFDLWRLWKEASIRLGTDRKLWSLRIHQMKALHRTNAMPLLAPQKGKAISLVTRTLDPSNGIAEI